MATDSLEIRDLTSVDHEQAFTVRTRSFGKLDDSLRSWWNTVQDELVAQRRLIGVFDGERLVAVAKGRSFQQFWGGQPVPMSGVAGVVVLPEYRDRGVASMMLRALAERCIELGDAVSALYPATVAPYRRNGWEVVGAQTRISIDARHLRGLSSPDVRLRPGTKADAPRVQQLLAQHYTTPRANGPKLLAAADVDEALSGDAFSYFTDDGFVLYEWHEADLVVTCMLAASEATARALWSVVGSGSSIVKQVHAFVSPDDPIHLLLPEEASHDVRQMRWMFRLLDAPRAVAARGFAGHMSGSALLDLRDPILGSYSGTWEFHVEGGRGSLTRAGTDEGALRLGPTGLAAMYAGSPLHTLRTAGLVAGGSPTADEFLDSAFAGPTPYLLEYF
jgi:predicted acetyltransferase